MKIQLFHIVLLFCGVLLPLLFLLNRRVLVLFFLGIIFFFPNVGWGIAEGDKIFNIYSKGTGILLFSFVNYYLWVLFLIAVFRSLTGAKKGASSGLIKYFLAFGALFTFYLFLGIIQGVHPSLVFSSNGMIHVLNAGFFLGVLLIELNDEAGLRDLAKLCVACAFLRGIWGIVRFFFLGGDPANPYKNLEGLNVNLTFFDIGDLMIQCMALFFCLLWLMEGRRGFTARLWYVCAIGVGLFNILFSFRRTAWVGLCLAAILLVWLQPWRRKIVILTTACAIMMMTFAGLAVHRFQDGGKQGLMHRLLPDVVNSGRVSFSKGRFSELYAAYKTIERHPVLGVGPWGQISMNPFGWSDRKDFVHSSVFHLWLKGGLMGLLLGIMMVVHYAIFCVRWVKSVSEQGKEYFTAAFGCFLFMIPTILFGTPIIEFRTMILLALILAIPYLVVSVHSKSPAQPQMARPSPTVEELLCSKSA